MAGRRFGGADFHRAVAFWIEAVSALALSAVDAGGAAAGASGRAGGAVGRAYLDRTARQIDADSAQSNCPAGAGGVVGGGFADGSSGRSNSHLNSSSSHFSCAAKRLARLCDSRGLERLAGRFLFLLHQNP